MPGAKKMVRRWVAKGGYKHKMKYGLNIVKPLKMTGKYTFKETYDAGSLTAAGGYGMSFTLGSIPQIAHYQNLFDEYKINSVRVEFVPTWTAMDFNTAIGNASASIGSAAAPRMVYSIQKGAELIVPSNEISQLQHLHKTVLLNKTVKVYIKNPTFTIDANPGGVSTYKKITTGYLDIDNAEDVVHNGLEFYITEPATSFPTIQRYITIYFTCKLR